MALDRLLTGTFTAIPAFVAIMALEGFFYTRKFGVNPPFAELNAQAYGFINEKLVGEGAVKGKAGD